MEVFLEIIKVTIPALIVFLTVYFLMREYRKKEENLVNMKLSASLAKEKANPSKISAYERLALFCERIKIDKLIIRLGSDESTVEDLKNAMIVAIRQEFDHNITQQIYVSHQLWEIIKLAKTQTITILQLAASKTKDGGINEFIDKLYAEMEERGQDPLDKALYAISEEAQSELNKG